GSGRRSAAPRTSWTSSRRECRAGTRRDGLSDPLTLLEDHSDVAGPLLDPEGAPLGARSDPPRGRTFVHRDVAHVEIVDVDPGLVAVVALLGVGLRRAHQLRERMREALRLEVEDDERLLDRLAADLVGEQPRLPRAHPRALELCPDRHVTSPPP